MSSIITARPRAWQLDLLIRTAGIVLLGLAVLSIMTLVRVSGQRPPHTGSVGELLLAAGGYLGASGGMIALTTGLGLFERVPVSPRHRLHRDVADPHRRSQERDAASRRFANIEARQAVRERRPDKGSSPAEAFGHEPLPTARSVSDRRKIHA